jgi:hypothetical protein
MTMILERPSIIRPDVIQPETRAAVDELYAGDTVAAFRAIDAATADPTEHVREWELTDEQRQVWEAGYLVGFAAAAPELMAEVLELRARLEQTEHDADRYYAEMCRRPAPAEPTASGPTFAEISRICGEHDRAARHEATTDRMFPQYAGARH